MPHFDPQKIYDAGSHDKSINSARRDLEADFPRANIFIWSNDVKPGVEAVSIIPLETGAKLLNGRFEIKSHNTTAKTYGYRWIAFFEGTVRWDHSDKSGPTWITYTQTKALVEGILYKFGRVDGEESVQRHTTSVKTESWMSDLRISLGQDAPLSALTIPSTHNSHAVKDNIIEPPYPVIDIGPIRFPVVVPGWKDIIESMTACQHVGVADQLKMGIRFLDFRLGYDFQLRHGRVGLKGHLSEVLDVIHNFLAEKPHEAVFVEIKWDMEDINGKRPPPPEDLRQQIEKLFFGYSSAYTSSAPPTLDSAAGKMMLKAGAGERGVIIAPQKPFNPRPISATEPRERWWEEIEQKLDWILSNGDTTDGFWYDVGLNGYYAIGNWKEIFKNGLIYLTPRQFAEYENPRLSNYLGENCSWSKRYRLGAVNLDFVDEQLVQKLILTNYL